MKTGASARSADELTGKLSMVDTLPLENQFRFTIRRQRREVLRTKMNAAHSQRRGAGFDEDSSFRRMGSECSSALTLVTLGSDRTLFP